LIYRFDSALLFYNSNFFSVQLANRAASKPDLKVIVIDAKPINLIDLTSLSVLSDLIKGFNENHIAVVFSGANETFRSSVVKKLTKDNIPHDIFYPGINAVYLKFKINR
jgi:MFS superfamily sulfate permease-like transporter